MISESEIEKIIGGRTEVRILEPLYMPVYVPAARGLV